MTKYTSADLKQLFQSIDKLCLPPFPRIEPLVEPLSSQFKNIIFPHSKVSTKSKIDKSNRIYPKNKEEVDLLFKEIDDFVQIPVPFKLTKLDEVNELKSDCVKIEDDVTQQKTFKKAKLNSKVIRLQQRAKLKNVKYSNLLIRNPDKIDKLISMRSKKAENLNEIVNEKKIAKNKSPRRKTLINNLQNKFVSSRFNLKQCSFDSQESGYSSQSSAPSPTSSLNSDDTLSTSSCKSNSTLTSTYCPNKNPDGKIVYIRSQYDYYFYKTLKKSINNKCNTDLGNQHYTVDNHQKVVDWRSKTLQDTTCPTPKHDTFAETPPQSPTKNIVQTNDDYLDFDCLTNYECNTDVDDSFDIDHYIQMLQNNCDNNVNDDIINFILT